MSFARTSTCPHCKASFQVAAQQLYQAGGRVRCGNCLQIFNGLTGEIEFVAPTLPDDAVAHPLTGIDIQPMQGAELPGPATPRPWGSLLLLLALLALLPAQLYLQQLDRSAAVRALELGHIAVRPHPEKAGALRVDAVMHNRSKQPAAFPGLTLSFTNRHGEPRAQRTFFPAEYLHANRNLTEMPPQSEVQLSLSLADPGRDAVNFIASLHFVKPPAN